MRDREGGRNTRRHAFPGAEIVNIPAIGERERGNNNLDQNLSGDRLSPFAFPGLFDIILRVRVIERLQDGIKHCWAGYCPHPPREEGCLGMPTQHLACG